MAPDAKRNLRFDLVPLHSSGNGQRWKAKEKLAWSNHLVAGYNFHAGDFPGGPVVNTPSKKKKKKNPPFSARDASSIPGPRTKIRHAAGQLSLRVATREKPACHNEKIQYASVKIPHATTKTRCSQVSKINTKKIISTQGTHKSVSLLYCSAPYPKPNSS